MGIGLFDDGLGYVDREIEMHPVGAVVDYSNGDFGYAAASFDETRRYRYRLSRVWDRSLGRVNFVMLNPSTADAFILDPTVRRCVGYAKSWGYGSLEVTNIFSLRATDPKELYSADDPTGPDNDEALILAAAAADLVVAGWGVHGKLLGRGSAVAQLLSASGVVVHCVSVTKGGYPGHPLYVRGDAPAVRWA